MENILSEGSPKTPRIVVDNESGKIEVSGRSNPENSREFFTPFMDWLTAYLENPAELTTITINLEHFNTSSSKYVLDVLKRIKKLDEEDHAFKIIWMYEDDDEEMLDTAEAYEAMVGLKFEKVGYPEQHNKKH
jgi:hypothetical protein